MSLNGSVLTEREAAIKENSVHNTVVMYSAANPIHQNNTTTPQPQTTCKSPGQICVSSRGKQTRQSNKNRKGARAQQKHPQHQEDLPLPQWEKTHCDGNKNMHKALKRINKLTLLSMQVRLQSRKDYTLSWSTLDGYTHADYPSNYASQNTLSTSFPCASGPQPL